MSPIIAQAAHPSLDVAARMRSDRLAKASNDQIETALAYLSMIDPEAFEIAREPLVGSAKGTVRSI
ncbi:MAG TPA: hypothetical protein VHZ33_36090 [Trebonia sp.]|nr:hypothetical protein [Trebonia sp.]